MNIPVKNIPLPEYMRSIGFISEDAFTLYGIKTKISGASGFERAAEFWKNSGPAVRAWGEDGLAAVSCGFFGTEYDYYICRRHNGAELEPIEIPAGDYAVFCCEGRLHGDVIKAWEFIYGVWFPNSRFKHRGAPEIEWYPKGYGERGEFSIWVPVEKNMPPRERVGSMELLIILGSAAAGFLLGAVFGDIFLGTLIGVIIGITVRGAIKSKREKKEESNEKKE